MRSPYCLYDDTDVEETDEVYVTKHALSLGRSELLFLFICVSLKVVLAILRHMFETSVSVQDCHLAMFFVDLVKDYADVLVQFPKECLCRTLALRKRAASIDMNMSRTRLSAGSGGNNWVANQRMQGKSRFPSPIPNPLRLCNQHLQSRTLRSILHLQSHNVFMFALALHFRW